MEVDRDKLLSKLRHKVQQELDILRSGKDEGPGEAKIKRRRREKEEVQLAREIAQKTSTVGTTTTYLVLDTSYGYSNGGKITWRLTPAMKKVVAIRLMYYQSYENTTKPKGTATHFQIHFEECYNYFNRAVANGDEFDAPDRYAPLFVVDTDDHSCHVPHTEIKFCAILPQLGKITMPWAAFSKPGRLILHLEFKVLNVVDEDQNSKIHS